MQTSMLKKSGAIILAVIVVFITLVWRSSLPLSATQGTDNNLYLPIIVKPDPLPSPWLEETAVTIPSYQYDHPDCLRPTAPGDPIFPYPRLDHDCVFRKPKITRTFYGIVLHNHYVSVTILPEMGGRLYRWQDKTTGRQLLYNNPVLKPTAWGTRGWWLATGGIEWAFPTDEHGLNEYRSWSYTGMVLADEVTITVNNLEDQTGMNVGVTLSLDKDHAYLTIALWVENATNQSHRYQYWLNAMVALDDNHLSDQTEFIVPANQVVVHSTGDGALPGEHSVISWPVYNGRSLNWYHTWNGWLGFFAPTLTDGFTGIYDHKREQGIVRTFNPAQVPGHKIFGPATLDPGLWTDGDSEYVEMWSSGVTPDFWTYQTLPAGQTRTWTEKWYPVSHMGGFDKANEYAALRLTDTGQGADLAVGVTAVTVGVVTLWVDGSVAESWPVTIRPGQPFSQNWERPFGMNGALGVRLTDAQNHTLIDMGRLP